MAFVDCAICPLDRMNAECKAVCVSTRTVVHEAELLTHIGGLLHHYYLNRVMVTHYNFLSSSNSSSDNNVRYGLAF